MDTQRGRSTTAKGRIVTFYSYKGGTGRSMALANFAWILASNGRKVLVIDWDLEAPGLHRYFRPFLTDPDLEETEGLIDCFWVLGTVAAARVQKEADSGAPEPEGEISDAVETAIDNVVQRLSYEFEKGCLDFLCAGRQDSAYSEKVSSFKWAHFYDLGGAAIIRKIKQLLRQRYDYVLIDSRTGVSDTAGICTIQMPDSVVACFTMNRQSIEGVTAILRSIRAQPDEGSAAITLYPAAMRIENAERDRLEASRGYARGLMNEFLPSDFRAQPRVYWNAMEVAYRPAYAFEEVLAAFGDSTGSTGAADTMLAQMEAMARLLDGDKKLAAVQIVDSDRKRVISQYQLNFSGVSNEEDNAVLSKREFDDYNDRMGKSDEDFLRGIYKKERLWSSSEFYWGYLLNSREMNMITDRDKLQFGRDVTYFYKQSVIMSELIKSIDRVRRQILITFASVLLVYLFLVQFFLENFFYKYSESYFMMLTSFFVIAPLYPAVIAFSLERPFGVSRNDVLRFLVYGRHTEKFFR